MSIDSPFGETAFSRLEATVAHLGGEVDALVAKSAKTEKPSNLPVWISLLALLFSFGTTGVSYLRTRQQDVHDARSELRTLIGELNRIPVDNVEEMSKYKTDPYAAAQLSGLLNNENALVSKQAFDVIYKIPDKVGATEYLNVANALVQSGLTEKAKKLYRDGLTTANDSNDEVNLDRAYGNVLFNSGDSENGRAQFQAALGVFQRYPNENNFYIEATHFLTELNWADAENSFHHCSYAKSHLAQAEVHLSGMAPGPVTERSGAQLAQAKQRIGGCTQ